MDELQNQSAKATETELKDRTFDESKFIGTSLEEIPAQMEALGEDVTSTPPMIDLDFTLTGDHAAALESPEPSIGTAF